MEGEGAVAAGGTAGADEVRGGAQAVQGLKQKEGVSLPEKRGMVESSLRRGRGSRLERGRNQ